MAVIDLEIDDLEIDISTVLGGFLAQPKKEDEETDNGEDDS